jgi:hypothetical protein
MNEKTRFWLIVVMLSTISLGVSLGVLLYMIVSSFFMTWHLLFPLPASLSLCYAAKMFFSEW